MLCNHIKTIANSKKPEISVSSDQEISTTIASNLSIKKCCWSTDSTVPDESYFFIETTKKIIARKLLKKKNLVAGIAPANSIDGLLIDGFEELVSRFLTFGRNVKR